MEINKKFPNSFKCIINYSAGGAACFKYQFVSKENCLLDTCIQNYLCFDYKELLFGSMTQFGNFILSKLTQKPHYELNNKISNDLQNELINNDFKTNFDQTYIKLSYFTEID